MIYRKYFQVVGDCLLISDSKRMERAIKEASCSGLLLKVPYSASHLYLKSLSGSNFLLTQINHTFQYQGISKENTCILLISILISVP